MQLNIQRREMDVKNTEGKIENLKKAIDLHNENQKEWAKDMKSMTDKLRNTEMEVKKTQRTISQREVLAKST